MSENDQAVPSSYTTPLHLWPVELWRVSLAKGEVASAKLSPTADYVAVVWYLDAHLQDAAQFQDREAAIKWAEDVRRMLSATATA